LGRPFSDEMDLSQVVEERRSESGKQRKNPKRRSCSPKPRHERWELTMRKTIIRSTTVVETGIRQVRDAKAGRDCLCALSAARQFLARLNRSLNASVARVCHEVATFAGLHAYSEPRFRMAGMPQWLGMSMAVVLPQGVSKPATPSGRVS
jgi:hypothetical protein